MNAFVKSILVFVCVSALFSFTACTKSKEVVRTLPPQDGEKNPADNILTTPEKEEENSKKKQSDESILEKDKKVTRKEQNDILDVSKQQSRLHFNAVKKNIILDAGESINIVVYLENKGNVTEENVTITIWGFEGKGVLESDETLSKSIDVIAPGQKETVVFPIKTNLWIKDSAFPLKISMVKGRSEPSILEIKATCRSKEKQLYVDICRKNKQNNIATIVACVDYIKKYNDGPHIQKVKSMLEDARWREVLRLYKQAIKKNKGQPDASAEIENIYLVHYGLDGRHSKNVARMFHELRDFYKACAVDNYEGYVNFMEKYKSGALSQAVRKRTTRKYWMQRYETEPANSHIWCQLAQATVAEKGTLGYREAERLFIKVLEVNKDNESAYIGLGNILKSRKNWDRCIEYLDHRRPPGLEHHRIYYLLGNAYEGRKNQYRARRMYSRAIEYVEKEMGKKVSGIRQCPYLYSDDKTRAIADIRKNPEYLDYLYQRGLIYREFLEFDKARNDFRKIIAIAPGSPLAESAKIYLKGM